MGYAIHYHSTNSYLALIWFTTGFGRYYLGKKLDITLRKSTVASAAGAAASSQAQCGKCLGSGNAVVA